MALFKARSQDLQRGRSDLIKSGLFFKHAHLMTYVVHPGGGPNAMLHSMIHVSLFY